MIEVYEKAGLKPSNVAKLLNLSRVAVSLWFNGHSAPHRLVERRVERLTAAIQSALKAGDLPISADVPRQNRHAEIAKVIHRHVEKLQLGPVGE
jgi:predicted transcriptional regulator